MRDKLNILLVEDDPNDVYFLLYAFEQAGLTNPTKVVEDGQEAIEYLSGTGKYADRAEYPLPYLILLDLKLPKVMGLDVLQWINSRPELCMSLVVVLSSSNDPGDIASAYSLGARSYLVKPHSLSERLELAKCIKAYWLELNLPPPLTGARPAAKLPAAAVESQRAGKKSDGSDTKPRRKTNGPEAGAQK